MHMTDSHAREVIAKIRARAVIDEEQPIGIVSSFCKATEVDTANGNRDIVSIVNTLDVDGDDEIVVPAGADWEYLLKNRQVFVDHRYQAEFNVGHVRKLDPWPNLHDHRAWRARTGIYNKPGNKLGDDLLVVARECGIGASVGFLATDYGPPPTRTQGVREADATLGRSPLEGPRILPNGVSLQRQLSGAGRHRPGGDRHPGKHDGLAHRQGPDSAGDSGHAGPADHAEASVRPDRDAARAEAEAGGVRVSVPP